MKRTPPELLTMPQYFPMSPAQVVWTAKSAMPICAIHMALLSQLLSKIYDARGSVWNRSMCLMSIPPFPPSTVVVLSANEDPDKHGVE